MRKKPASAKASPGRPRSFDAEEALHLAMAVFWEHGYKATSLESLCHAMRVSRSSFYACFGTKHALLMAAVQRYADDRYATLTKCIASIADPGEAVRTMLAVIADIDGGTRGCLFVNAVSELAPGDDELITLAKSHTARVGSLMTKTLQRLGCPQGDASERAGALLALAMGVTTLRKTGVPPLQLMALLNQAEKLIPTPPSPKSSKRIPA